MGKGYTQSTNINPPRTMMISQYLARHTSVHVCTHAVNVDLSRTGVPLKPSVSKWMVGGMLGNRLSVRGDRVTGFPGRAVAGRTVRGRTSSSLGVLIGRTPVTGLVALADLARERAEEDRRDRLLVME